MTVNILALPAEIRLNIYSRLFTGVTFKIYCGPNTRSGKSRPLWPPVIYISDSGHDSEYPTLTCVTEYITFPKSLSIFLACKYFYHDMLLWDSCVAGATFRVASTTDVEHLSRSALSPFRRRIRNNILATGHMNLPRIYTSLTTTFGAIKQLHHRAYPCCCWWTYFPHNLLTCDPTFPKRMVKAECRPCREPGRVILDHCTPVRGTKVRKPLVEALKKGDLRLTVDIEMWLQGGGGDGGSANYIGTFDSNDWVLRIRRKDEYVNGKVWEIPQLKVWEVIGWRRAMVTPDPRYFPLTRPNAASCVSRQIKAQWQRACQPHCGTSTLNRPISLFAGSKERKNNSNGDELASANRKLVAGLIASEVEVEKRTHSETRFTSTTFAARIDSGRTWTQEEDCRVTARPRMSN